MTDRVWIADVFAARSWPHFAPLERMRTPEPIEPIDFQRRYEQGVGELEAAHFPEAIFWDPDLEYDAWPAKRFSQLNWSSGAKGPAEVQLLEIPDFAHLGRYIIVSDKCREVLSHFDLGGIGFHPIRVFQSDGETEIQGTWFCIVFANRKSAFDAEASQNIREVGAGTWMKIRGIEDSDLAVSAEALAGPAIWIDPAFNNYVFFSDEVHSALKENNCTGVLGDMKIVRVS